MNKFRKILRKLLMEYPELYLFRLLKNFASGFLNVYFNANNWDMSTNGELFVLKHFRENKLSNKVVMLDVGANSGEWSMMCAYLFSNPFIHSFEIVPDTFTLLKETTKGTNIVINNFGLSDQEKIVSICYFPSSSAHSSVYGSKMDNLLSLESKTIKCKCITGDSYVRLNNIPRIDFLKIDTEGHDYFVLKGFRENLQKGRIGIIQFEVGHHDVSKISIKDFYDFLDPYSYKIGRLLSNKIDCSKYNRQHELRGSGNYIAIHKSSLPEFKSVLINRK